MQHTQVIILGGSLVGLSASLFLAYHGVPHVLVEKHPSSSPHPRAMGFTERSLEYFRLMGLGEIIPQAPVGTRVRRVKAQSLAGEWFAESQWTPGSETDADPASPCHGAAIAQDKLEPILRERARVLGADIRTGNQMTAFCQDSHGVTLQIRNLADGTDYALRGQYLIAADGASSLVREQLGIQRDGVGYLKTVRSVLFQCPEADVYLQHGVHQFEIEQNDFHAFLTTYQDGRWVLMFTDNEERNDEQLQQAIRRALGANMAFTILSRGQWEMAGRIATQYRKGRVFLAGDAAHQLPPTRGGFGANTGIDDVYNLAWKLAYVLAGKAGSDLLISYDAERQPIGLLRHQQTFARPDYARWLNDELRSTTVLFGDTAMELGQLHRSTAVVGINPDLPEAAHPNDWAGQPGVRAPHIWLTGKHDEKSTIDVFCRDFTLISADANWLAAAGEVAVRLNLPIRCLHIGVDLTARTDLLSAFGMTSQGAVLIRPDGIICWRNKAHPIEGSAMVEVIEQALVQILARNENGCR
ncbi:FAD-dependent monooxygenase [Pseudoalteromonas xiamenensis]